MKFDGRQETKWDGYFSAVFFVLITVSFALVLNYQNHGWHVQVTW
jgi:hypothetical protein